MAAQAYHYKVVVRDGLLQVLGLLQIPGASDRLQGAAVLFHSISGQERAKSPGTQPSPFLYHRWGGWDQKARELRTHT